MARAFHIRTNIDSEVKKALRDIARYDKETARKLKKAVKDGTRDTMSRAKHKARIHTGNLIRRITMRYDEQKNVGKVISKAPHSHFLELGVKAAIVVPKKKRVLHFGKFFTKVARIPARKAHPFMEPAIKEAAPRIEKDVEEALKP